MLLEFSCSNYKSIRNKINFSMLASPDHVHEEMLTHYDKYEILKSAVIYGANGSGKSNFLEAIHFVKELVTNSMKYSIGQSIIQSCHKLENNLTPSNYSMQFITQNIRYAYGFTLKNSHITEEYLYYFPNGKQAKIFEREENQLSFGVKFRGKFKSALEVLQSNRLFLSCGANFSKVQEIITAYQFFSDDLIIYNGLNKDNWLNYSLHQIYTDSSYKELLISFFQQLGVPIQDIKIRIEGKDLSIVKQTLVDYKVDSINAKLIYPQFEIDLINEESAGIKKLFAFLCPFISMMKSGKTLIVDELENSLHEHLVYDLLKFTFQLDTITNSQIIFTTHDTSLLTLSLFRRDQIWFTELNTEDRSTDLYALSEIRNVRNNVDVEKAYIAGKYGGIPMLNINFVKLVSKVKHNE